MTYKYTDPVEQGLTRVKLTKAAHNQLFKYRQCNWKHRYEYYLGDDYFEMHELTSLRAKLLSLILFPISVIGEGIFNIKDTFNGHRRLIQDKKYGFFVREVVWSSEPLYDKIKALL